MNKVEREDEQQIKCDNSLNEEISCEWVLFATKSMSRVGSGFQFEELIVIFSTICRAFEQEDPSRPCEFFAKKSKAEPPVNLSCSIFIGSVILSEHYRKSVKRNERAKLAKNYSNFRA